jgi:hypothetical protein
MSYTIKTRTVGQHFGTEGVVLRGGDVEMTHADDRLSSWLAAQRESASDTDICAGLGNGDIPRPEWMGYAEDSDHLKVWDLEVGSVSMGFYRLDYDSGWV